MQEQESKSWVIAFALIYFTFFLDNVLLTVLGNFLKPSNYVRHVRCVPIQVLPSICLVPIIPDWVRGSSLAEWGARGAAGGAPLARVLNATVHRDETGEYAWSTTCD